MWCLSNCSCLQEWCSRCSTWCSERWYERLKTTPSHQLVSPQGQNYTSYLSQHRSDIKHVEKCIPQTAGSCTCYSKNDLVSNVRSVGHSNENNAVDYGEGWQPVIQEPSSTNSCKIKSESCRKESESKVIISIETLHTTRSDKKEISVEPSQQLPSEGISKKELKQTAKPGRRKSPKANILLDFLHYNPGAPCFSTRRFKRSDTVGNVSTMSDVTVVPQHRGGWMRSQSMQEICATGNVKTADELARDFGINLSLYQTPDLEVSAMVDKSAHLVKSAPNAPESFEIREQLKDLPFGTIHFTACYYKKSKKLLVHIAKIENLPPRDGSFSYNVVAKLSLLPADKKVQWSEVQTSNLSPSVEEDFSFQVKETSGKVLRMSVYDADLQGKYDAIGHALFYLEDISGTPRKYKMKLYQQSEPDVKPGIIHLSLTYREESKELFVHVIQARRLLLSSSARKKHTKYLGKYNTYVKASFFCQGQKMKTKKSPTVQNSRDPIYNHTFRFQRPSLTLGDSYIVVSVLMKDCFKGTPIGRFILGPFFHTSEKELTPWGEAILENKLSTHWCRLYL